MSAPLATPTAAYRQQSVLTATPGQLVVMLYDGCLRFLHQAAHAMRDGDRLRSGDRLRRAEAIIGELMITLDHEQGGEIADRLQAIYVFARRQLIDARREQDADMLDTVAGLLAELRDSWAQIAAS
jgi:flagellar secretion chaperone FliS